MTDANELRRKWIEALRSGKYKQGRSMLFNSASNKYCCLGVAEIVFGTCKECIGEKNHMLLETSKAFNLSEKDRGKLIELNDFYELSFTEIADIIESGQIQTWRQK